MNYYNKIRTFLFSTMFTALIIISINEIVSCSGLHSFAEQTQSKSAIDTTIIFTELQKASGDKFAEIYLFVFFILAGAVLGRFIAKKINQPAVLGELIMGVIIGVIMYQFNSPMITLIRHQDEVNKIIETNLTENITWHEAIKKNIFRLNQ